MINLIKNFGKIKNEVKLLFYLFVKTRREALDKQGWVVLDYEEAMKVLNITRSTLFRYIKALLIFEYIEQFKEKKTVFRIKPEIFEEINI